MNSYLKKLIFNLLLQCVFLTVCFGQSDIYKLNYKKATLAANAGKYQEALGFYTLSIEEQPTADAFFDRASVYNFLGDSCNFCKDLESAAKLGDNEAMNLYHYQCTRTVVIRKIPDSLKVKYPGIKQVSFRYSTCTRIYYRDVLFLDENDIETTATTVHSADSVYTYTSTLPQYIGGEKARNQFLSENLKYPEVAANARIEGTSFLSFVVDEDGNLTDIKVIRGIGAGCDEEAIRVLKLMPKWQPATHNGKSVRVMFNMPINFKLSH